MSSTYLLCALILAFAGWVGWRELDLYHERKRGESDLFVYSRRRLCLRALGLVALAGFALTLACWEALPPKTPTGAGTFMGLFAVEIVALIVVPLLDLLETRQTSAGEARSPLMQALRERNQRRSSDSAEK